MLLAELQRGITKFDLPGEGNKIIIDDILFERLLSYALRSIEFDESWYLLTYSDVREALKSGLIKSAKDHFVKCGYLEGRLPRQIAVDDEYYKSVNPDVAQAIKSKDFASFQEHFERSGAAEGRHPTEGFSLF